MTDDIDQDAVAAILEQRLAEGRAAGRYSDELDEQLASQFHRAAVDPLTFPALDALRRRVATVRIPSVGRLRVPSDSAVPGGTQVHKLVVRLVARQVAAVMTQVIELAQDAQGALGGVIDALEEMRSIVTTEVFGEIDSVHHRLVAVEQRLARLEVPALDADSGDDAPPADASAVAGDA